MSTPHYPRIGRRRQEKRRPRNLCGAKPTGLIDVEVNYRRGDDEGEPCCKSCQKRGDDALMTAILAVWESASIPTEGAHG